MTDTADIADLTFARWANRYPTRRAPTFARNVVSTSQPLAAQAGLRMLLAGGNAVDAALATAIALTVVEPISNGVGSDAFAIVWDGTRLHGLNGSGRAPAAWTPDYFKHHSWMPRRGWDSVTVPGAVQTWVDLSERFGRLDFATLFGPAIAYAREGFNVSPFIASRWKTQLPDFEDQPGFAEAFMPNGRAPRVGEVFRLPELAETLETIAATRGEAFYRGPLAEAMVAHAEAHGGAMSLDDLGSHRNDWVEPISLTYRGLTLHELPPNPDGIVALIALGILSHFDMAGLPVDGPDGTHLQIEALKLAFADSGCHVGDIEAMRVRPEALLDPAYLAERARLIDRERATHFQPGSPPQGGTVYLTAADSDGMMVSFIQSNFQSFGSGVVVPGTGISLQDRGAMFSLEPGHPNQVGPGKRSYHTIIPAFVSRNGEPLMTLGVMGGPMQPQGHVQVMARIADHDQNPQEALDGPRFRVEVGSHNVINLEPFPADTATALAARGHRIESLGEEYMDFGCGQIITRLDDGYAAASDARRDSLAVGF